MPQNANVLQGIGVSGIAKLTRPKKSPIEPYSRGQRDFELRDALNHWRFQKVTEEYGSAYASDLGGSLVMPNAIMDRIVDCAHYGLIKSTDEMMWETHWIYSKSWGVEVLEILRTHAPPAD